ncbi:MAG: FMN-binding negative transcriptional regulator [Methylococcaceae bacterium]|nr:FMN-binding negative transcriptional regulator [Methylococcaceae bacterium]
MYVPAHFEQTNIEMMHALMRSHPLATLVTLGDEGLNANHIPLYLNAESGQYGVLQGHVARANPLLDDSNLAEVLVIFHGPNAYISPTWYATKPATGKVVPTWNYTTVHAYGKLQQIDDATWLRTHLEAMTDQHEANMPQPWQLSDAPHDFTERLLGAIVGIEIVITRLSGKWKVSQNQPPENQISVVQGLSTSRLADAGAMADLVALGVVCADSQ